MSKSGDSILRGAREAAAYARGNRDEGFVTHVPEKIDVRAIRERLELSQREFARAFGFELRSIHNWESDRRTPRGATRAYLRVIEREPEAVRRALAVRR